MKNCSNETENLFCPEASIIGALATDLTCRKYIFRQLSEYDFLHPARSMFIELQEAFESTQIDLMEFTSEFIRKYGTFIALGKGKHWKFAIRDVIEASYRRRISEQLMLLQSVINNTQVPLFDIRNEIDKLKSTANDSRLYQNKIVTMKDIMQTTVDRMDKIKSGEFKYNSWGIPELDFNCRPFEEDFCLIASRPGIGKSIIAINSILHSASIHPTGYWCSEMAGWLIGLRSLTQNSNVDFEKLQKQENINKSEAEDIRKSIKLLSDLNIYVSTGETLKGDTVEDIHRWATKIVHEYGVKTIFIDYIQLISATFKNQNRREQIHHISLSLKQMAKELKITVFGLAQLNRIAANERPALHHLSECSALENDASTVILIDRIEKPDDMKNKNYRYRVPGSKSEFRDLTYEQLKDKIILIMAKSRHSKRKILYLDVDMATLKIGGRADFGEGLYANKNQKMI